MAYLSAKEVGRRLELTHLETIRRIRRGQIKAQKFGGWMWAISEEEVQQVRKKKWYKDLMRRRARYA